MKAWAAEAAHDRYAGEPLSNHLNEWLENNIAAHDVIELSCRLYELMVDETKHLAHEFMPYLRIPLTESETLDTRIPSLADLEHDHLSRESPSFYLIKRDFFNFMNPFEHYICPVEYSIFQKHSTNIYMYYSISRGLNEMKNNWEYGRNIVAEYYPDALIRPR